MKYFDFGVLAFLHGLSKCFNLNFPSDFFLPYVSFKPTVKIIDPGPLNITFGSDMPITFFISESTT